jgi:hypothetical protein
MKKNKSHIGLISGLSAVVLFLISLALNWSDFFPTLGEVNPWDEAVYVKAGQEILRGEWPNFAGSPLTATLYAITDFVFRASPFWLVHSVATGRLIAYALIWLSAFLIGKRLVPYTQPFVMLGMLLATPFYFKMLRFPSDPFFLALSGLALWQLLTFRQTNKLRYVILASVFIALAAAARNDGLIIFIVALIWVAGLVILKKTSGLAILGLATPFILIVGGYALLHGLQTGNFALGTTERTYENFEAGQIAVYSGEEGLNAAVDARREAQRLFGTADENDYSVYKAILRNPPAYIKRLQRVSLELPGQIIKAYSGKWIVLLVFWVAWGIVVLCRKRDWSLLALLILWITPLFSGFIITIFRTGHLLFPSLVIISLAAIGLMDYAARCLDKKVYLVGLFSMIMLLLLGIITSELVVIYATGTSLAAMILIRLGQVILPKWCRRPVFPLLLFFIVGILLHGPFSGFGQRITVLPAEEQALLAMTDKLPKGARVLAGSPGVIYAANMTYMGLASTDVPVFSTSDAFDEWLVAQAIKGVYIDETMTIDNQVYWKLLQELAGKYEVIFQDPGGEIQVWVRKGW